METKDTATNVIAWENIRYQRHVCYLQLKHLTQHRYSVEAQQGKLEILHGLSGYASGGRLLAVMGASGSG